MAYNPGYVDGVLVPTNSAYVPGSGMYKILDNVGGAVAYWMYCTSDSLTAVQATGYITDATFKRLKVGDIVDVFSGTFTSESATSPVGAKLGGATFPATLGVVSLFTAQPAYQRMIVSAVTAGTTTVSGVGTLTAAEFSLSNFLTNPRNMLDGGDATINPWQRGTASFVGSSATAAQYTADRWFTFQSVSATSATVTKTANTTVAGFTQAFAFGRAQSSGAVSPLYFGQVLESLDSYRLQGQGVTFSFYAAANTGFASGVSGSAFTATIMQGFGTDQSATSCVTGATTTTGSWSSQSVVATQALALTTSAQRFAISGLMSTTATQVGVLISYTPTSTTATTAENILMNGFQLEVGGLTPFEHREIEQELAFCQRYFFQVNEPGTSGSVLGAGLTNPANSATFVLQLPVQMRAAPTVTVTNGSFGALYQNAYIALTSMAAGSTHTVNYISVNGLATMVSSVPVLLISSSATTGKIQASADL